jgi:hypothetical protein
MEREANSEVQGTGWIFFQNNSQTGISKDVFNSLAKSKASESLTIFDSFIRQRDRRGTKRKTDTSVLTGFGG